MHRALVAAASLAVLVSAAPAVAHGPARIPGYTSTVIEIDPPVLGLTARVLGGDETLALRNWSGKTVVVYDEGGEPMFRLGADGVFRHGGSRWTLVRRGTGHGWHDSRIHWGGDEPPTAVQDAPERDHRIANWRIPLSADGKRAVIHGVLGWSAQPASGDETAGWIVPVVAAGSVLAAATLVALPFLVRRRGA